MRDSPPAPILINPSATIFLGGRVSEQENPVLGFFRRAYEPALDWAMRRRRVVLAGAAFLVVASGVLATRLGSEFIPRLGEGALAIQPARIPSISLRTTVGMARI